VRYTKPALHYEQQAQRLLDRGMIAPDKQTLVNHLQLVNYYRLSAYWYTFKQIDENTGVERYLPGTHFATVWRRYCFDRELRLIVMDAVERIEVAILRTRMVELFACQHGPFGYTDPKCFNPEFPQPEYDRLMDELDEAVERSNEEFVGRFQAKYPEEAHLPLWMAVEVMTFGQLYTFYRCLHRTEQQTLAQPFGIAPPVLESWLHTLNFIRNACAHPARLWNRELPIRPSIPRPRRHPEWHIPSTIDNRRIFAVLTLLRYLLRIIDPTSDWHQRLIHLLEAYPDLPYDWMGFPDNWQDCPIWSK